MAIHVEPKRTGEHLVSEANGSRSRRSVLIQKGEVLDAGTLLVSDGDTLRGYDPQNDDIQGLVGILYGPVDATDASEEGAKGVAHIADCEVDGDALAWPASSDQSTRYSVASFLSMLGVVIRGYEPMPGSLIVASPGEAQEVPS